MPQLILASTSPYRRELLARLKIPFESCAPRVDEQTWKEKGMPPWQLAVELATAKAASLAGDFPEWTILGSDQVCACEEQILGKPHSASVAQEQLAFLAGKEHQLITAVAIWQRGTVLHHTDVTKLRMRQLSAAEIDRYVAADRPLDCAGSYKLEALGITLFDSIESADHTAIVGLPLLEVAKLLRIAGFEIP